MRIALGVEYDGSAYCGFQYQDHSPSIQQQLESAISRVANHEVRVHCAGRTDTGVHAYGQIIHFDSDAQREPHQWVFGANTNLPGDISVLWAQPVPDDFHARYSAERRSYRYVILNRRIRPAIMARRVSWEYRSLDVKRMQQAAVHLVGEHDFSSYRALACQAKSPVRILHRLEVERYGDYITLDLEANGFLHHMVRNIAGVLITIGAGEQATDWSRAVLETKDRTQGGITAPPDGLYFVSAHYPVKFSLPALLPPTGVW